MADRCHLMDSMYRIKILEKIPYTGLESQMTLVWYGVLEKYTGDGTWASAGNSYPHFGLFQFEQTEIWKLFKVYPGAKYPGVSVDEFRARPAEDFLCRLVTRKYWQHEDTLKNIASYPRRIERRSSLLHELFTKRSKIPVCPLARPME